MKHDNWILAVMYTVMTGIILYYSWKMFQIDLREARVMAWFLLLVDGAMAFLAVTHWRNVAKGGK